MTCSMYSLRLVTKIIIGIAVIYFSKLFANVVILFGSHELLDAWVYDVVKS